MGAQSRSCRRRILLVSVGFVAMMLSLSVHGSTAFGLPQFVPPEFVKHSPLGCFLRKGVTEEELMRRYDSRENMLEDLKMKGAPQISIELAEMQLAEAWD